MSELLYSPALYGIDLSSQNMPKPRARCSPMMAVVGNTLWVLGGTVEVCPASARGVAYVLEAYRPVCG